LAWSRPRADRCLNRPKNRCLQNFIQIGWDLAATRAKNMFWSKIRERPSHQLKLLRLIVNIIIAPCLCYWKRWSRLVRSSICAELFEDIRKQVDGTVRDKRNLRRIAIESTNANCAAICHENFPHPLCRPGKVNDSTKIELTPKLLRSVSAKQQGIGLVFARMRLVAQACKSVATASELVSTAAAAAYFSVVCCIWSVKSPTRKALSRTHTSMHQGSTVPFNYR